MKRLKNMILVMTLFLSLIISGCSGAGSVKPTLDAINLAMSDTMEQSAIDMYISVDVTGKRKVFNPLYQNTVTVNSTASLKISDDGVNPTAYFLGEIDGKEDLLMYYVDGFQYTKQRTDSGTGRAQYESKLEECDFYEDELGHEYKDLYKELGINMDELESLNPSVRKLKEGKYEIKIKKADLKKIVDLEELQDVRFGDMIMYVWLDADSGLFTKLEATFTFQTEEIKFTVEIRIELLAINDEVIITIPDDILVQIESIKNPYGYSWEKYVDTADGAVKYYRLGTFGIDGSVLYDDKTDKFIISRKFSTYGAEIIHIYDSSFTILYTFNYPSEDGAVAVDCDNGVLAVSRGSNIYLYSLETYSIINTIKAEAVFRTNNTDYLTDITVNDLILDGNSLMYAGYSQTWYAPFVILYNLASNEQKTISDIMSFGADYLTVNRKDHVAYAAKYLGGEAILTYYDSQTGEKLCEIDKDRLKNPNCNNYTHLNALFDNQFVHFYYGTFDPITGALVSDTGLNADYNRLQDFNPFETILNNGDYSLLTEFGGGGFFDAPLTAIYDNDNSKYIYSFNFSSTSAGIMKDGRIYLVNGLYDQIAILDMSKISGEISGNYSNGLPEATVTHSDDGRIKTLSVGENYSASCTDEKYVYFLSEETKRLSVFDINTLERVYTERFLVTPAFFDAADGYLAVGFTIENSIRLFNTYDWSSITVETEEKVRNAVLYDGQIIYFIGEKYTGNRLQVYNIALERHTFDGTVYSSKYYAGGVKPYFSCYNPAIAINRENGILYIGECDLSSCDLIYLDIKTFTVLFISDFGIHDFNRENVTFDGTFIHFYGKTFDKDGQVISDSHKARGYQAIGYSYIKTVFDDGNISIFTAIKENSVYTVFYNLETDEIEYEILSESYCVYRDGNLFVLTDKETVHFVIL